MDREILKTRHEKEEIQTCVQILQEENAELKAANAELRTLVKYYEELYRLHQHKKFGASSEKTHPEQLSLFDEAENEANKDTPELTVEQITYIKKSEKKKLSLTFPWRQWNTSSRKKSKYARSAATVCM